MEKTTKFDPEEYELMTPIGKGNFSELFMVESKSEQKLYTMKIFSKQDVERLHKEEDVLVEKHVREKLPVHPFVVDYFGSHRDEISLYILYEYINGGELWQKCSVYGVDYESLIKTYFLQVLEGIEHMHKNGIVHRDIKVSL